MIKLGENGDLDGAGRGHYFVGVQEKRVTGGKIEDGYAQHAVEFAVFVVDGRIKLLPEELLLGGRRLLGGSGLRGEGGEQRVGDKRFSHFFKNPCKSSHSAKRSIQ